MSIISHCRRQISYSPFDPKASGEVDANAQWLMPATINNLKTKNKRG